ncbi:asparagine synthase (glutamine-hydrolyzing) [Pseudoalteromonas tetraodonis]|uniref:asparagine synthase (glutamine-hydrolyzing) n=1 Tax=Pseudoalteromonas tetraodonis TaxID=43659 RepID=UPI000849C91B|nr:asparagine synthase (glutamine-hydrolyzing) [Pseudoalteromonas tetraodonis]ODS13139.1 asparagine synthase (glutamine-hydrolyzing) [Pseudoalteromonas tetraodonis]
MCGFSGFFNKKVFPKDAISLLKEMGSAIRHRGPDSSGEWIDEVSRLGFSHRRLAIVDLSPAGHQPMQSQSGKFVISFNGEIYNHLELRAELEGGQPSIIWQGHSDTETLLMGFDVWGVKKTIEKSIGMFAFSVWDRKQKTLILGRDRLGEKPLYYGWQSETFLFGSELKALRKHPDFRSDINHNAIALQLRHNYIPAPYSIYNGINKLLPGSLLTLNLETFEEEIDEYWSIGKVCADGKKNPFVGTPEEAVVELESVLKESIKQQMMADVPLGAFLSGGIDSSVIVALMQAQSDRPIKTFSIGFDEEGYNEAVHARAVAKHLGTEHTELYVTPEEAMKVIPQLAELYDEPFSDSSQIPTYIVAKMAKEHVTVSLSGDAGDELFCGYNRYIMTNKLWSKLSKIPQFVRTASASFICFIPIRYWNAINRILPSNLKMANLGDKMHKAAGVLAANSVKDLYKGLVSHWQSPEDVVINGKEPKTVLNDKSRYPLLDNDIEQMMALDTVSYLPDDILTKVDRACMGVSLEGRVPFLNHKVVEFAWSLPLNYKLRNGIGKWCLREVLFKHVPRLLIERPKMGFGVPIDAWLRGPLKEWAYKLLDEQRLKDEGFFDPEPISKMWIEHQSGKRNWQYHLWDILMFQAWYEKNHK